LTKLLDEVADVDKYDVVLEVGVENPAYSFYRRLGFRPVTEILHYEMPFDNSKPSLISDNEVPGFRELRAKDRSQLYRLYKSSISHNLRQVIKRGYGEFNPSMIVRQLDWAKNYLMRKRKHDFVVEQAGKVVALLTINSYLKTKNFVISLILNQSFEYLRRMLLAQAVNIIKTHHPQGVISITIYGDNAGKQVVLERLGFSKDSSYYLMFRPAYESGKESIVAKPYRTQAVRRKKI
jgi:hypothetical protein